MLISVPLFGQNIDYNKIILPEHSSMDFVEKLVQLAWKNHPTNDIYRREVNIADYQLAQSRAAWLDIVRFTGNLNEFTINPNANNDVFGRAAFYPRYNIGASLSLGQFFTIPANNKKNKEILLAAQSTVNAQKLATRATVIKAYNEFLMHEKIYKLQSQLMTDNETSHKIIEQRFKNGETTFEIYSQSLSNYSQIQISVLEAEKNYKNFKLDLEQLIGVKLEEVR